MYFFIGPRYCVKIFNKVPMKKFKEVLKLSPLDFSCFLNYYTIVIENTLTSTNFHAYLVYLR